MRRCRKPGISEVSRAPMAVGNHLQPAIASCGGTGMTQVWSARQFTEVVCCGLVVVVRAGACWCVLVRGGVRWCEVVRGAWCVACWCWCWCWLCCVVSMFPLLNICDVTQCGRPTRPARTNRLHKTQQLLTTLPGHHDSPATTGSLNNLGTAQRAT